jgi:hypothetical protein
MDQFWTSLTGIAQAMVYSFMMFLFGRMLYALNHMRGAAKKTWQTYFTEFLTALLGMIGIAALILLWIGV